MPGISTDFEIIFRAEWENGIYTIIKGIFLKIVRTIPYNTSDKENNNYENIFHNSVILHSLG
jgi:hypothetical protein